MSMPHLDVMKLPGSLRSKAAILKASPSIVGVVTYDVPVDVSGSGEFDENSSSHFVFHGHGIVLECEVAENATYDITIVAPAMLFNRTNDIKPHNVKFDVCVPDGTLCKGKLEDFDFHYNLAAIKIQSNSPLQPASLGALNDFSSINIDAYELPQSHSIKPFRISRHSNSSHVYPGTEMMIICRSFLSPFSVEAVSGAFCTIHDRYYDCKELYWVNCSGIDEKHSGAVVNLYGEVMGIMFYQSCFLPSNIISRWWDYYKSKGTFCRPWVGVEIANISDVCLSFLEEFRYTFPEIGTGVIVTKVEKETPADKSGLRPNDVIVKCGGECVQSKMKFFVSMWDNVGESVDLEVLRLSDSQQYDISMSIQETAETNFYRWMSPALFYVFPSESEDKLSDSNTSSDDKLSDSAPRTEASVVDG